MKEFIVDEDFHSDVRGYPELIRCCDCINCVKEPNGELYCDILAVGYEPLGSKKVNSDWFCADGAKKDELHEKLDCREDCCGNCVHSIKTDMGGWVVCQIFDCSKTDDMVCNQYEWNLK